MTDFGAPDVGVYFSAARVAELLGVSSDTVRQRCQAKEWPHLRIGNRYRFTTSNLEQIEALSEVSVRPMTPAESWDLAPGRRQERLGG